MSKTGGRKPKIVVRILRSFDDPRIAGRQWWPVQEILFVFLIGRALGKKTARDMVNSCAEYLDVYRQFLPFANGIPPEDVIERMVGAMNTWNLMSLFRYVREGLIDDLVARGLAQPEECNLREKSGRRPQRALVKTPVCSGLPLTVAMDEAGHREKESAISLDLYMDWDKRVATFDAIEPLPESVPDMLDLIYSRGGEYMVCVDADGGMVEEIRHRLGRKTPKETCERTVLCGGTIQLRRYEPFNGKTVIPSGFEHETPKQVVRLTIQKMDGNEPAVRESFYVSSKRFTAEECADILDAHLTLGDGQEADGLAANPEEKKRTEMLFGRNCGETELWKRVKEFCGKPPVSSKDLLRDLLSDKNRLYSFILFIMDANRERKIKKMPPVA